jgi:hypothetical protein
VIKLSGECIGQGRAISGAIRNVSTAGTELKTAELNSIPLTKTVQDRIVLPYLSN